MRGLLAKVLSIACLAFAAPAFGGAVYVPYTADITVSGVRYETQIWASNRGSSTRRFQTLFIGVGEDGTARAGATPAAREIGPSATLLLADVAPNNAVGMLEVNGAPQVVISARIVPAGASDGRLGAHLPVISSETLLPAGSTANLQGLARGTQQVTDFVLTNVAHQAASCTISLLGANGAALVPAARAALSPLSTYRVADILGISGQTGTSGARMAVSCDKNFYAYALTFDSRNSGVTVIKPAATLNTAITP